MVHGGFRPCSAAFDCPFPGYSLMKTLAGAGYDMFALDMTGHDHSTLPLQANPANISPEDGADLAAGVAEQADERTYPFRLASSDTETADLDAVVDLIRELPGEEQMAD